MAEVKGMKGLRFQTSKAGSIQELCCPPYDIISEEQRKAYLERNEHNVIRLELPRKPLGRPDPEPGVHRRDTPGSIAFVPPVAGLIAAGEVVRDLAGPLPGDSDLS